VVKSLVEVVGFGLVVGGLAMVAVPVALVFAGAGLLAWANVGGDDR
jgi:hypothetical protein